MRVIAGKWKGRILRAPRGHGTRPVLDRVREAIFDMLGARLTQPGHLPACDVLDLFAGSGAMGIEALSRGARSCCFVEQNLPALAVLAHNLGQLQAGPEARIIGADACRADVELGGGYQLIFIDPPYAIARDSRPDGPIGSLLTRLASLKTLTPNAYVVLRHPSDVAYDQGGFGELRAQITRQFRKMTVTFLTLGET